MSLPSTANTLTEILGIRTITPPDNYPQTITPQTITPLGQIPPGHLPPEKFFKHLPWYSLYLYSSYSFLLGRTKYPFYLLKNQISILAFVPEADVIDAFEAVSEDFPLDAQAVIDYFEDTYIGRLRPGGHRRAPLFDMELWNMYNQTIDDLPRTNNAVEGWHRSFQANVGAYHPNFWRFIDILKREQNLTQVNIAQARAGHPAEPQRRRYQDSNQRIKNIVQDYPNRNIMQYLRGLAHNISM